MSEAKFSFTCKANGDLLTVRGDTFDEFHGNLATAVLNAQALIADIGQLQAAGNAAPLVVASAPVANAPAPAPQYVEQPQNSPFPPQTAPAYAPLPQQQPAVGGHQCAHGPMRLVTPKAGQTWSAFYACSAGKNSGCKTINA